MVLNLTFWWSPCSRQLIFYCKWSWSIVWWFSFTLSQFLDLGHENWKFNGHIFYSNTEMSQICLHRALLRHYRCSSDQLIKHCCVDQGQKKKKQKQKKRLHGLYFSKLNNRGRALQQTKCKFSLLLAAKAFMCIFI